MIGIIVIILLVISALLLIGVIMLQDEQGEGLGGIFGGGSGSAFGSRAGNMLTRITSVLAVVFLLGSFVMAMVNKSSLNDSTLDTARQEKFEATEEGGWYTDITEIEDSDTVQDTDSILMDIGEGEVVGESDETPADTEADDADVSQ